MTARPSPGEATRFNSLARSFARWLVLSMAPALVSGTLAAAPDQTDTPEETLQFLESRRATVEAETALPDDLRSDVLELLTRAIDDRRRATEVASATAALARLVASSPARLKALESERNAPPEASRTQALEGLDVSGLNQLVLEGQQKLQDAREALTSREQQLGSLTAAGFTLSDEIASRKQKLRELQRPASNPPVGEVPAAAQARQAYARAREDRLAAEITRLELQRANYELLLKLATQERDVAALRVKTADEHNETLVAALESRRVEEARAGREQALATEAQAADLPAPLVALAGENASLREELESVTLSTGTVAEQLRSAQRRVSELEAELVSIRERVATVGPTGAIGRLLRKRLASLRDVYTDRLRVFGRSSEIVQATDRRIDLGELRRDLTSASALLADLPEETLARRGEQWLRDQANVLIATKRTTIDDLHEAYARYLTQLTGLDAVERQMTTTAQDMRDFINRQLLWTQSLPPIALSDFSRTLPVLSGLVDLDNWKRALHDSRMAAGEHPLPASVGLVLVLLLMTLRRTARRALTRLSELTGRIRTDQFRHTMLALLLTVIIAAAWPAALAYTGLLMGSHEDPAAFTRHIGMVLVQLAILMIIFATNRWLIHYHGLARAHFRWPEAVRVNLRLEFSWLTPVAIVCVALATYGAAQGATEGRIALGRPALIVFVIALAVFLWRLLRRDSALMQWMRLRHPTSLATRTWPLWFAVLMLVPAVIVLAAAMGYNDAAVLATKLLIDTGWLMLAVFVLRDVMLRWFTVAERRLRYEQALKQRDEARSERERRLSETDDASQAEMAEVEVPQVDLRELGSQGRSMVQLVVIVGVILSLSALWSALLPALDVLDGFTLPMNRSVLIDGVEQQVPVTLNDLLTALLVLGGTLFAAKNLSGVLSFTVFRRLAGDAGVQYAIVTLCQYALVAAGALYAFSTLGVQWSRLQWLVAALGVGLGFGLQEIVANFVSGIILLIERPVRVGDIVTVGDATGRVSRIRIRATTIVDWDRKELVVPNKEFVTGRLLNWTLTNDVVRLVVPVGIAYGSDARLARELLQEAASENEHVLDDPGPIIVFSSFGDNALGLELRVYLPSMSHWLTVQTELHDAIYEKLAAAGIGIAFPQRDVHLDTTSPLDIRVHQASDASPGAGRPWRRRPRPS